jgi:hypothetical protein
VAALRTPARETAGALAVILGSVACAVLLGAGVWYGLAWMRDPTARPAGRTETLAPPAAEPGVAPVTVKSAEPAPASAPAPVPRASGALPGTPAAVGLEGVVTVLVMPGARITVDGRNAGQSPRELHLSPGAHRIQVSHPNGGAAEETLDVVAGERKLWTPTPSR